MEMDQVSSRTGVELGSERHIPVSEVTSDGRWSAQPVEHLSSTALIGPQP
jgi:hypothetical protein